MADDRKQRAEQLYRDAEHHLELLEMMVALIQTDERGFFNGYDGDTGFMEYPWMVADRIKRGILLRERLPEHQDTIAAAAKIHIAKDHFPSAGRLRVADTYIEVVAVRMTESLITSVLPSSIHPVGDGTGGYLVGADLKSLDEDIERIESYLFRLKPDERRAVALMQVFGGEPLDVLGAKLRRERLSVFPSTSASVDKDAIDAAPQATRDAPPQKPDDGDDYRPARFFRPAGITPKQIRDSAAYLSVWKRTPNEHRYGVRSVQSHFDLHADKITACYAAEPEEPE